MKKVLLIFVLLFLFSSCSSEVEKRETSQTSGEELISPTEELTIFTEGLTEPVTAHTEQPIKESYRFDLGDIVIVEWGDIVDLDVYDDGTDIVNKYKGVGINYIKIFESTKTGLGDSRLNMPERRYSLIDEDIRDDFMDNHDDILIVKAECTDSIVKGERVLTYISRYGATRLPITSYRGVGFFEIVGYESSGEIDAIPVIDGKVKLPEDFYEGNHLLLEWQLSICRENLIKLGLEDRILKDGMTVKELDEFFELVTDSETFAPLFD